MTDTSTLGARRRWLTREIDLIKGDICAWSDIIGRWSDPLESWVGWWDQLYARRMELERELEEVSRGE